MILLLSSGMIFFNLTFPPERSTEKEKMKKKSKSQDHHHHYRSQISLKLGKNEGNHLTNDPLITWSELPPPMAVSRAGALAPLVLK